LRENSGINFPDNRYPSQVDGEPITYDCVLKSSKVTVADFQGEKSLRVIMEITLPAVGELEKQVIEQRVKVKKWLYDSMCAGKVKEGDLFQVDAKFVTIKDRTTNESVERKFVELRPLAVGANATANP